MDSYENVGMSSLTYSLAVFQFVLLCAGPGHAWPARSDVAYLSRSDDYRVWVNGQEQFVYESLKNGNHGTNDLKTISFVGFDLDETATVRVRPARDIRSFELRPYSAGVMATLTDHAITFTLSNPEKLVLVLNGSYEGLLVIVANPPHTPPAPADVEYFFGPGVHRIGIHRKLFSGDDVYIARGAVVEGSFTIEHAQNVTITGRGLIACDRFPHQENFQVVRGIDTRDVLIEGVTICNAPGWIISFWEGSTNLTVRNVTMVGNWLYNTDGVQTGTTGLLVEDCFLQCNDDNFSLNGLCRGVIIRNNVLWNTYNGAVFMLGWATGKCFDVQNLDIYNNVIFRAGGCCEYDPKGPFSMRLFGSHRKVQDIRFRNIIIEDLIL